MKKPTFYVTTSIAYANAKPHAGYAMELLQADTLARWHRQAGVETYFLTGTDEHGQKLFDAAEAAGQEPLQYVNELSQTFVKLTKKLHLSNDAFVRTTYPEHKKAAQKIWEACQKDIYKGTYSGLYCIGCEQYYTESEAVEGNCPIHKTPLKRLEVESYFFKLSAYQEQLIEHIESGRLRIVPQKRRNEMLAFARQGLEDTSISRPKNDLNWGVEVPGDDQHVMYVWFDALTNYISAIGYASDKAEFKKYWPANVHVIGKDIARFHCLLWPAMLMSAGLEIPESVYVHPFISSGGHKMSKSLGNVIDPIEYIDQFGVDPLRYYLLRYIPSDNDGDMTRARFIEVYNADLANNLGNLVARVSQMLIKYNDGKFEDVNVPAFEGLEDAIANCKFDRYLEAVFERLNELNATIEEQKPWELTKNDPKKATNVLNGLAAELIQVGKLLEAFLPETAQKIQSTFADGKVDQTVGILFPRIQE